MNSASGWLGLCLAGTLAAAAPAEKAGRTWELHEPTVGRYHAEISTGATPLTAARETWLAARPENGTNRVEFGCQIVLQLSSNFPPAQVSALPVSSSPAPGLYVLTASDPVAALDEADRLGRLPGVTAAYPLARKTVSLDAPYAVRPNDTSIANQFNWENRGASGARAGADLNARSAWAQTLGAGITVAVADIGVQLTHPELVLRSGHPWHHNFADGTTNGMPFGSSSAWAHGTEVAGLIAAEQNNSRGISGLAPGAQLASWVIFTTNQLLVDDQKLMEMYRYASNTVAVQNHSWSRAGRALQPLGLLEAVGINDAVLKGRDGKGVVIVRSAGNDRDKSANANEDAAAATPLALCVAATKLGGAVTSYSEPGACVLVAAVSGDTDSPNIYTTDLTGTDGINSINFPDNLNDYVFGSLGFNGTSASAPQIAGLAALILSANTNLSVRDVQLLLALSGQHFFTGDPDIVTNGAGLRVSHNVGYGLPDAGLAVRTAKIWPTRAALTNLTLAQTNSLVIPDAGLRVLITGDNVPVELTSLPAVPGLGLHADDPTAVLPLVDIGLATNVPALNLTNKAALIQRGVNNFDQKILNAAQAGAAFAIIYNNTNTAPLGLGATDYVPIPAVMIPQAEGTNLHNRLLAGSNTLAQIRLFPARYTFTVTNPLVCEHIGVTVSANHPTRGDLRITLRSPAGTRSIMQRLGADTNAGPANWTYWSTHHFLESSVGEWTVDISDEFPTGAGSAESVGLTIRGTAITDTDADGLDDAWENTYFTNLTATATADPDQDGFSNAAEQAMGTNPNEHSPAFALDLSKWNASLHRLSWPGNPARRYEVWAGTNVAALTLQTNTPGLFPETEFFFPPTNAAYFLRVVSQPK